MKFGIIIVITVLSCLTVLADGEEPCVSFEAEKNALESFFRGFKEAFNSRNSDRVRNMSGASARQWLRWMKGKENLDEFEIVECVANSATNVTAKVYVIGGDRGRYAFDAVFAMKKSNGEYSIETMTLPESDRLNQDFDKAAESGARLIKAINDRDMDAVKETVSFGDNQDFEAMLTPRGLSWIKESIDNGVRISRDSMIMSRASKTMLIGQVGVPFALSGTNIMRKVVFKDGKIDRAAPREETKEEFLRRFEKENAERRRQFEKERAERERKENEEALKHLQKLMK